MAPEFHNKAAPEFMLTNDSIIITGGASDAGKSQEDESLHITTMASVVDFFARFIGNKPKILNVFSGKGRVALDIAAHADLDWTGITLYQRDKDDYENSAREDMFGTVYPVHVGDAVEVMKRGDLEGQKFQLALLEPPRFGRKRPIKGPEIIENDMAFVKRYTYIEMLTEVLDRTAEFITTDGYILLFADDQTDDGEFLCPGYEVAQMSRATKLVGIKHYVFPRRFFPPISGDSYIPVINHKPMYIFQTD